MKKLLVFLLPVLFIFACKNVEQYRAPIEALSTDWDRASAGFMELGSLLSGATTMLTGLSDSLNVDPIIAAKLKPETTNMLDSMKTAFMAQLTGLNTITPDVTQFSNSWNEMGTKLVTLKDGLNSGKLEGDVMAQVNELKTAVQNATSKTEDWKFKINAAKNSALTAYDLYKQTLMTK